MQAHGASLQSLVPPPALCHALPASLLLDCAPRRSCASTPRARVSHRQLRCSATGLGAACSRGTFFASLFARLSPKLGAKAAAWTVAHRLAPSDLGPVTPE